MVLPIPTGKVLGGIDGFRADKWQVAITKLMPRFTSTGVVVDFNAYSILAKEDAIKVQVAYHVF